MVAVIQPAGAGETTGFDWNSPADFERGTLTFKLFMHDAKKVPYAMEHSIVVAGSDLYDRYPPVLLDLPGGRKVEVVHMPAQGEEGVTLTAPAPGLLYVPPAGVSARMALRWAGQYVARGMAVSIVSQPGTGGSTGPSDRSGPASVAAVEAALARLVKQPNVDPKRIVIWGLGDGGSTALLTALKHPEVQGVVAQNAEYDPWRAYRALPPADQEAFLKAVGRDSTSWRARAPGLVAQKIVPAILVLHSASMGEGSRIAAEAFVAARAAKNLDTETRIDGNPGSPTSARRDFNRLANDFLARRFRP
jgi:pimeloyl-ACP methyl ester carboxylesterase